MSKFRTWLNAKVLSGEFNSGVDKVERDGFIPLEKHLEMMKYAGRRLRDYRAQLSRSDFENIYDPIEAGEFDEDLDIRLAGMNARRKLEEDELERRYQEERAKIEAQPISGKSQEGDVKSVLAPPSGGDGAV